MRAAKPHISVTWGHLPPQRRRVPHPLPDLMDLNVSVSRDNTHALACLSCYWSQLTLELVKQMQSMVFGTTVCVYGLTKQTMLTFLLFAIHVKVHIKKITTYMYFRIEVRSSFLSFFLKKDSLVKHSIS